MVLCLVDIVPYTQLNKGGLDWEKLHKALFFLMECKSNKSKRTNFCPWTNQYVFYSWSTYHSYLSLESRESLGSRCTLMLVLAVMSGGDNYYLSSLDTSRADDTIVWKHTLLSFAPLKKIIDNIMSPPESLRQVLDGSFDASLVVSSEGQIWHMNGCTRTLFALDDSANGCDTSISISTHLSFLTSSRLALTWNEAIRSDSFDENNKKKFRRSI